jgi:hypothetical protein
MTLMYKAKVVIKKLFKFKNEKLSVNRDRIFLLYLENSRFEYNCAEVYAQKNIPNQWVKHFLQNYVLHL